MRVRGATWLVLAAIGAASLTFAPIASAREPTPAELAQARELFAKAERDERAGDWRAALEKLERAGAVKMTAGIRFHIALCRESLGELVEALAQYELAAQQAREAGNKDVLDAAAEPLTDLRARVPSLTLSLVNAATDDVEITLDGRAIAAADLGAQLRVAPGPHHIVAKRRSDGQTFAKELTLKEREAIALDLRLPARTGGAAAAAAPNARAEAPAATTSSSPSSLSSPPRTAAIVATGGALLFVAGGITAFVLAEGAQDDLAKCNTVTTCDERRTPVRTWDTISLGAFVAGAGVGALAAVLWLTPPAATPRASSSPRWGVAIGPGRASLAGSF